MLLAAKDVRRDARRFARRAPRSASQCRDRFACEITDDGPGLDDPIVGYLPPGPTADRGAGLWVARQLTERLELLGSGAGYGPALGDPTAAGRPRVSCAGRRP